MHTSLNKIAKSLRADKKKRSNGRRRNNDSNMCGETKKMGAGYYTSNFKNHIAVCIHSAKENTACPK